MKVLPRGGRVDPDLVDLGRIIAQILDVAQDVAFTVLAQRAPKESADSEVQSGGLFDRPFRNGEALDQDEALTVDDGLSDLAQERGGL